MSHTNCYHTKFLILLLLTGLTVLSTNRLYAQHTASISGYVKDAADPITDASIKIVGTTNGTKTTESGYFELKGLKPGTYTLLVSSVGYLNKQKTVSIIASKTIIVDFNLTRDSRELKNLEIKGKSKTQESRESEFAVQSIDTRQYANTTADLNQILSRSAGIRVRQEGGLGSDFQFSLNGLSGKSVRFFMDGIPMEDFGTSMSLNNIPVNLAERVEVYKGVVPVELGSDALGGAINVVTNQNLKKYMDVSYSYGSFNTHRAALNTGYTDDKTGLYITLGGFYNYSDNNYTMKGIELPDPTNSYFEVKDVKRFHNVYHSGMAQAEVGIRQKNWADLLSVGFLYSGLYNEQQTGATQNVVYGQVHNRDNYLMTSLKYKKDNILFDGLKLNLFAAYARNKSEVVDTSLNSYKWDGSIYPTKRIDRGELGLLSIYNYVNSFVISRVNLSYKLNDVNSFNLNYNFKNSHREGFNELLTTADYNPSTLTKHVLGLSWQTTLADGRLVNQVFGKYYGFNVKQTIGTYYVDGGLKQEPVDKYQGYYGYGIASRFKLTENWGLKGSFEYAYRLQEIEEMFGNGIDVIANSALKPESSYNANIGTYLTRAFGKSNLTLEANGFYRNTGNYILNIPAGAVSQYMNIAKVRVTGIEADVKYRYANILRASLNATYQHAINTQQYINGNTQAIDLTYTYKLPNQPWFIANVDLGIGRDNLLGKDTRIELDWYSQYVHWFYLTWSDLASSQSKAIIPTQFIHNASLTYSMKNGKYNVSFEATNLTDRMAYDNFRLQRPGRAMMVKLRYSIK